MMVMNYAYTPTGVYHKSIGAFQPGDYTFTLEMDYYDRFGVPTILNMGTAPFTVSPPPSAVSVPTGDAGIPALLVAIVATAALALRRRKSSASSSGRFL
jgi:MYXO-CTERM domain-containing protein